MAYNSPADNYVRAFTAAFTIVSGQDTTDDSIKDVAATVGALAEKLWKQQNKFVDKEGYTSDGPKTYGNRSSGGSGGSGSGSSGLTPKQRNALNKAYSSLGDAAPYTMEDIEAMNSSGGTDSERSQAISEVFTAAWGDK